MAEANDAFCALVGRGREELSGLHWRDLVMPQDHAVVGAALRAVVDAETRTARLTCRVTRAGGSTVRVSAGLLAVPDGRGGRCVIAELVEQPLPDVDGVVEAMLDATPDLLAVTTPEGRVVRVNAVWERVLGWTQTDMRDLDLITLLHPDDASSAVAMAQREGVRNRCRTRDGGYRWLEWRGAPLPGTGLVCETARDVTDAVAAEQSLRRSEVQFRAAFEASPLAMAITGEAGRFLNVNPALSRLLDRPAEQLTGRDCGEFTHPGDQTASRGRRRRIAADPDTALVYEQRFLRPDGQVVWARVSDTRMDAPSGRQQRLVQIEDVTAARQATVLAERETARLRNTITVQQEITAAASDRDAVLALIADRTLSALPNGDACLVQVLDEPAQMLRTVAEAGRLTGQSIPAAPLARSLTGLAVTAGVPVRCDDTATDPRASRVLNTETGTRSLVAAPLRDGQGRVTGVLLVGSGRPHAFDDADEQQLTLLAHALSGALQHAHDAAGRQDLLRRANAAVAALRQERASTMAALADRTRALNQLEVSEQRFRSTFDNSPLGLTLISLEPGNFGRYLQANSAMTRITGFERAELAGMTYRDLVQPDDAPGATDHLTRVTANPIAPARAEFRYRHKDGHTVWVAVTSAAVRDDTGHPLYLVNQVEDVTHRRAADIELRRQARLLELIPAAVIVRELDGTIRWWNRAASSLYGWPATTAHHKISHRLLGTVFPGMSTADDQAGTLLRHGHWDGELQHRTAHGDTVTVLSQQILHYPTGHGEDPQVLVINTDITALRAAEQALAENEQRLRAQFTNSAAGQVVRALDGQLIAVNPACARMLGHTVDELLRLTDADLLDPGGLADSRRLIADLCTGYADHYTYEGRLRHADGHWVDVEATVSLIHDPDGRPKHIVSVITDITRRRAAERGRDAAATALAERNTELESANQLKLDIIGMLGHEIGNPLTSIRGNAELLSDDWPRLTDARRARAIDAITRQSGQLDGIVREVLAMVTIEAGKLTAARQNLDLRQQIAQALTAADSEDLPVYGDNAHVLFHPGQLQQILVNLLSNAAKYGGGATAVRITHDAGDPGHVHVSVEDNGPGVPEEFRNRLFERLSRADRDAGTVRGTGLGLYIVRGLAHANHGDVHHEPNPAGGSIFTLDLETTTNGIPPLCSGPDPEGAG
ncbi:PAS domain S-box-containing protein [Actinoplanes campanulatus]|uniref:histidine kinase n=1 Tax=Actinoplanes campanulatus TaxID=113559 RepID=A0A7W5FET0_9ACTN|nr:PAS domain S-box protein [Actinoplanes campanulatus]MBB3095888.1 PAS domain S-box-containing protein [Actinoplanes campanulatus]